MEVIATCRDRVLELKLKGELDHHGARGLLVRLEREIEAALPVELDSAGIAVTLRGWQRMRELGGRIELHHVAAQPRKVLETAGVGRMMSIL